MAKFLSLQSGHGTHEKIGRNWAKPQFLQQSYGGIRRGKIKIPMQRSNWVYRIKNGHVKFNYRASRTTPNLYGPKMNMKFVS
jgi:hypothetical protein